ncbi:hypothetical protein S83_022144, partial [Arachis hypogaea]
TGVVQFSMNEFQFYPFTFTSMFHPFTTSTFHVSKFSSSSILLPASMYENTLMLSISYSTSIAIM